MDGLGRPSAGVGPSDDREAPARALPPVQDDGLGILEAPRQLLPEHPARHKVRRPVGRLRSVHDAQGDRGAVDGGFERRHGLRVREAAEADVVHGKEEVPLLKETK